jgi:hypothetical protein
MVKPLALVAALTLGAGVGGHPVSARAAVRTTSWCADSSAAIGAALRDLRRLATSTAPTDTLTRHYANLPVASSGDLTFVSDTTACRRASETARHVRFNADTGSLSPIVLIGYGTTRFIGSAGRVGQWSGWLVLDSSFVAVGVLTQ